WEADFTQPIRQDLPNRSTLHHPTLRRLEFTAGDFLPLCAGEAKTAAHITREQGLVESRPARPSMDACRVTADLQGNPYGCYDHGGIAIQRQCRGLTAGRMMRLHLPVCRSRSCGAVLIAVLSVAA